MKRSRFAAALLLAACAHLSPAPSPFPALEARVARAIDAGDTATLESLVAPGFALTAAGGRRVERDAWIANTRRFAFDSVAAEVSSARIHGDTAEVSLWLRFRVAGPDRPAAREAYRLSDLWVRTGRSWRLARRDLLERQTRPL